MKTNWTLLLTSVLLLAGFFLVRSTQEFSQGLGYAFILGACAVQLRYILKSISTYRKRQLNQS
ncbi:hypothetical protein KZC51_02575 [Microbacterium sp. SSW1-49]|uniref:DUF3188 domain-containing protein n=1 Tax=Microbacterium croceum TaxID=2851645 RepID=A0ABT0FBB8_9MICO|nr:hypothetical protein [Microbacterium croceum]MCK2035012.1 hypothetical protein [Microbacterium croceum]